MPEEETLGLSVNETMQEVITDADWFAVVTQRGMDFNLNYTRDAVLIKKNIIGLFSNDGMKNTAEDLKRDSYIEILAPSTKYDKVFRFEGTAEIVKKNDLDKEASDIMLRANPKSYKRSSEIVTMDLDNATRLH